MTTIDIPKDIFESHHEIVIILPLGGVKKKSISLQFEDFVLHITGERSIPHLKDDLLPQQEECFWGTFHETIQLPPNVVPDRIQSIVNAENILIITIPKSTIPGKMKIDVKI